MYSYDIYMGIDPGASGGVAVLSADGCMSTAHAMPYTDQDLYDILRMPEGPSNLSVLVCLEKVHSMPKQGVRSTFTFGVNYGKIRGMLTCLKYSIREVSPTVWQKFFINSVRDEDKTKHKNRLKQVAQQMYPSLTHGSKITLKTCDALLLAHYAMHKIAIEERH